MTQVVQIPEGIPVSDANFRLQNKRVHLTYPGHIDLVEWDTWWLKTGKGIKNRIDAYSFVTEVGKSGYKHTHVLLEFDFPISTRSCRYFDYESMHPNIVKVVKQSHWDNIVKYHYKDGMPTTNIVPAEQINAIEAVWKCSTVADALLKTCKKVSEAGGVIAAFNCKPTDHGQQPEVDWRPW